MTAISVVVAAYNEEAVISASVKRLLDYMRANHGEDWELIFVNDGSRDQTGPLLDAAAPLDGRIKVLHHSRNFGQGRALRTAFEVCSGDVIVTLDADLSYGPEYIGRLIQALEENRVEIALASAFMKGGTVANVPLHRYILSKLANRYLAAMSHYDVATSTCVVRAYRREVIDSLYLSSDGMELQLEILMKAAVTGFRVCEIPADLRWADSKAPEAGKRRSKMKIAKTIGLYLKIGWLSKPAVLFLAAGAIFFLGGAYMALMISIMTLKAIMASGEPTWALAISGGVSLTYAKYTYSFAISSGLLILGFQFLVFALIFIQSQFYYEELYKIIQETLRKTRTGERGRR
jgi:glycosyltransferase involved in cell wall biosynthesis